MYHFTIIKSPYLLRNVPENSLKKIEINEMKSYDYQHYHKK